MNFICDPCKEAADIPHNGTVEARIYKSAMHQACVGKGRCDCQHRVRKPN